MSENTAQKPVWEMKAKGGLSVAIWRHEKTEAGRTITRHSVTLNKRFRDKKDGAWHDSSSYFVDDLPRVMRLLEQAFDQLVLVGSEIDGQDLRCPGGR
ncbi:MAG: hypothetical protein H6819_02270 [Phycisphaerales bacterium]|nr:hypothetical protein [Phycisphaerales bacterium]MCB9856962.1 hypothetical protein [Phycisphaerales bacterium]MCB9861911.1 hypothetical protein [Phycisphaerales bacterium]